MLGWAQAFSCPGLPAGSSLFFQQRLGIPEGSVVSLGVADRDCSEAITCPACISSDSSLKNLPYYVAGNINRLSAEEKHRCSACKFFSFQNKLAPCEGHGCFAILFSLVYMYLMRFNALQSFFFLPFRWSHWDHGLGLHMGSSVILMAVV